MFRGQMANILMVALLEILYSTYCYFLHSSMYNDKEYHKNCIVAVVLSQTHLSVCSVLLTLRASPKATPPSFPIKFPSRLCLDNIKIKKPLSSETHSRTKYKDKCVHGNQIAMVIVKSEWLNLRLLVTEG